MTRMRAETSQGRGAIEITDRSNCEACDGSRRGARSLVSGVRPGHADRFVRAGCRAGGALGAGRAGGVSCDPRRGNAFATPRASQSSALDAVEEARDREGSWGLGGSGHRLYRAKDASSRTISALGFVHLVAKSTAPRAAAACRWRACCCSRRAARPARPQRA